MTTPDKRLAERVRFHRKRLGLTQEELGARLEERGLFGGFRLVQDIEGTRRKNGQPRKLGVSDAGIIALALGIDPDEFRRGIGTPGEDVRILGVRAEVTVRAPSGEVK